MKIRLEVFLVFPDEDTMKMQWQEYPYLFKDACWAIKENDKSTLVFTTYCLN